MFDLYKAFECAKKNKKSKSYVKVFEQNLYNNLLILCNDLWERKYIAEPSTCFIITQPKKREVFAANFRDRIVHHLYFNYTHELFERTFITDSYSCIKNKGTHFGIHRLEKHIRKASNTYSKKCYILKMDIRGYFMNIDRKVLLRIVSECFNRKRTHRIDKTSSTTWDDVLDFCFIGYLSKVIILLDPTLNCRFRSEREDWKDLPKSKSLFHSPKGCGLPIGNLTSQLFSNVYLNVLDQYMKRILKMKHYGRYVDDFYVVSTNRKRLREIIPLIRYFLKKELHLELHMGKTQITSARHGVEFLGAFVKPYRTYISNQCLRRIRKKLCEHNRKKDWGKDPTHIVNSYLGMFSHYSSYRLRTLFFCSLHSLFRYGIYNSTVTKMTLKRHT